MKTLAFCAAYAVFACVFCIGFAASQLPSETVFMILAGVIVVGMGIGFTLFFAEEIRKDFKQIGIAVVFLGGVCGGMIYAYTVPTVRSMLIGSWSSEIVLTDALAQTNAVGQTACYELLKRDRLTAIRAIEKRPVYAQSQCIKQADESFKKSLLTRWDQRLATSTGTAADATAIKKLATEFPIGSAMLFDCAVRAPNPQTREKCAEFTADFDVIESYQKNFGFWSSRNGLSTRFTASFNERETDARLTDRTTRRLVLRHVCEQQGSEKADRDLQETIEGWMKHLTCFGDSEISVFEVCANLSEKVSTKDGLTAESEVCAIVTESDKQTDEIRKGMANNIELGNIGQDIESTGQTEVNLDKFIDAAQKDPSALENYTETEIATLMGQLKSTQAENQQHLNRFSKEALRQKRIDKVLGELRAKKGMEKFFNEDGSINEEAVYERASEEGVELDEDGNKIE